MISIQDEYKALLGGIYQGGKNKDDRTGTGTKSVFGRTIIHDMELGFPILTSKRVSFNAARTELLWMLHGRTDLKYLEDNGVKYWRPDYERSGRTDGTLGPVYGKQWRDFNGVDQLENLINDISINPTSRRLMVSAWNPAEMSDMVLPPCHYGFQVYINNDEMDLIWTQRSVDVFLGLPYDIAIYGLLLEMLAKGAGLKPGQLIGQLGDCHLYNNHLEQAKEYLDRSKRILPKLQLDQGIYKTPGVYSCTQYGGEIYIPKSNEIKLLKYNPYPTIKAPLSVGK